MLAQEIRIRGEPTADPQKCRFVLDGEVLSRASMSFNRESNTDNSPLAKKLLELPYITQVNIAGQVVTLTGDNVESWPAIGKEIGSVIRDQMKSGEAPVTEVAIDTGNNELFNQVNELIKNDINPSIASHGGVITLQSVSDGKAYVTMGGGCKGCSASSVTLKQGVESYIVAKVDGVTELVDITNHVEGENPYYTEPVVQASSSGCGCSSGKSGDSGCGC
ncbi:MAG TPA: NifU family protein [Candidatus Poseidoniia archaeon]|jgi:Fe-S cluster biogenesis protein NfuA|nr:NifU family protein [Candidatus Poseidoniia archaeon]MDP7445089.1 NifU family protein [Candidatus Poseidoniia archaeon]MDP7665802.1 NifU family protein [Candidatus Poseidoniia archaeon]HJL71957.1 NifU family protein [Candidatus Poseidoniia archaeon]HJN32331.1 NifU family protein [Candidatus Poseidoniia archaeon]|tara:strand:+ start:1439 stop:2098 length:660 start_codon:yes stop_codon:yes gene_type:complete